MIMEAVVHRSYSSVFKTFLKIENGVVDKHHLIVVLQV